MTAPPLLSLHDRDEIEAFLRRDPLRHVYALGDLDPFFWERTVWYGLREGGQLREVCLLYLSVDRPTLLGFASGPLERMRTLLRLAVPALPRAFHAQLTAGCDETLTPGWALTPRGRFLRMGLTDPAAVQHSPTHDVVQLTANDLHALRALYARAYPDNFFDPRMLATGEYFGIREGDELLAVAGIHVYSPATRVAALGNVTTHPDHRRRGLAADATAALCRHLLLTVDQIALNVHATNTAAVACYQTLGFEPVLEYFEFLADPERD